MEDDDEDLPMAALPRPTAKEPTQLSVDDLVYGDDRLETIFFLMTLDELMALVAVSYTHFRAQETPEQLVSRLVLDKKNRAHTK